MSDFSGHEESPQRTDNGIAQQPVKVQSSNQTHMPKPKPQTKSLLMRTSRFGIWTLTFVIHTFLM